jgi:hypothetical protein
MDRDKLQNLLDSLDEGPLGVRKDWQWERAEIARNSNASRSYDNQKEWTKKMLASKKAKGVLTPKHLWDKKVMKKRSESRKVPIAAYHKDGTLFKVFKSTIDACDELGIGRSTLYDTINGRQQTCRGYIWKKLEK